MHNAVEKASAFWRIVRLLKRRSHVERNQGISRRNFLSGAALAGAALASGAALTGCAPSASSSRRKRPRIFFDVCRHGRL
ncbi:MAG: twin-arginine translocation signal domain-containing protein [Eggerthellaceae bacterium]